MGAGELHKIICYDTQDTGADDGQCDGKFGMTFEPVAMADYRPMTFIDPNGMPFVIVARNEEFLEWAVNELFGDDEGIVYDNSKTLRQIIEAAVFGDMGIAMCNEGGITFIEPKRLSQTLDEDDDF